MKKKTIFKLSSILLISFILMLTPIAIYADETDILSEEQTAEETEQVVEQEETNEEEQEERSAPSTNTENQSDDNTKAEATSTPIEEHKVAVITTKVDQDGNPLSGAVLQILDENGNIVDEWTSDGTEHTTLLPEGNYVLHEVSAPEGYKTAADKPFTVAVEINDITAGVDYTLIPCEHYGSPFYYVESNGVKQEVYCINQDWETPDDNPVYNGNIITPDNIRDYTNQTVYVDAHQNKERKDISDQSLSNEELYNKILDIIYHRQKASKIFSDLSEEEIRFVTESALKNYTNAGLTRVQRIVASQVPEGYDKYDYYKDGKYIWYLYPHFRTFVYDPSQPLGKDVSKTIVGEGDAFGVTAGHWSAAHDAKNSEASRQQLARYYELYQYLISDEDHHPADMHLYVYSTSNPASGSSRYNFDDGAYQNLLGITWFNPYDENYKVELEMVNKTAPKKETPKKTYKNPQTGDNTIIYMVMLSLSLCGLTGGLFINKKEF